MKIKTEKEFRKVIEPMLKELNVFIQPIETGGTGVGVPDLYCCYKSFSFWIEFKIGNLSIDGLFIKNCLFQAGQLLWHTRLARYGGTSFIMIYDKIIDTIIILNHKKEVISKIKLTKNELYQFLESVMNNYTNKEDLKNGI